MFGVETLKPLIQSFWGNVELISNMAVRGILSVFGLSNEILVSLKTVMPSWCLDRTGVWAELEFCSSLLWLCVRLPSIFFMCYSHLVAFQGAVEEQPCFLSEVAVFQKWKGTCVSVY